ncbi:hypothetical protein [Streptomyces peucetius]|uniref:Uncharacterized protein n=1 Tax=Streptomyces peucetius TaxID=1950 RepID=A0ABY6IAV7_STRPE|nr:hypothetical protein [Streptomyces peucetius]UYQ63345.1 hypothetical protein OGH68_18995 [Streptomyces peucetius]
METLGSLFVLLLVGGVLMALMAVVLVSVCVGRWRKRAIADMERQETHTAFGDGSR